MDEQCGGRSIAICNRGAINFNRREPQQHELAVTLDGFDLSAGKILLKRGRVINEIRFPEPHGKYPPAHNRSPQAARYCFDFRKFRHEGIANKIAHPLATTQVDDANLEKSAIGRYFYRLLLLIVRVRRRSGNHDWMRLQGFQRDLDCLLKLRVVASRDRRWIIFHFDVRRDAVIFHFPLAV